MVEALKENTPDKIGTFKIGSCIGSHSGPGVLGILSFKNKSIFKNLKYILYKLYEQYKKTVKYAFYSLFMHKL